MRELFFFFFFVQNESSQVSVIVFLSEKPKTSCNVRWISIFDCDVPIKTPH